MHTCMLYKEREIGFLSLIRFSDSFGLGFRCMVWVVRMYVGRCR